MRYILDPLLFALDEHCNEKEFQNFVKRVISWERWLDKHPDEVYILSDTEKILSDMQAYPFFPRYQTMLDRYKINYVRANDLNKTISRLLTASKKIDRVGECILASEAILTGMDLVDADGTPVDKESRKAFEQLLWSVYCHCQSQHECPETYMVFAKNLSADITMQVQYQTMNEAQDDFVDHEDRVQIICRSSLKDFFCHEQTANTILSNTSKKEDLSLAIRVSVYQRGKLKKWIDSYDNFEFTIQDSFIDDYNDAHYCSNTTIKNRLMEEMSNVLLNERLDNREEWRKDIGASSGQEKKNGYAAFRWFVTRSVKMMYWQKDKHRKFANVKEHDIFVCQWED